MLAYEEKRTEEIVNTLVGLAKILRIIIILYSILLSIVIFYPLGLAFGKDSLWLIILLGVVIGFIVGKYSASFSVVTIEWFGQTLVALENAVTLLRKIDKNLSRGPGNKI